MYAECLLAGDGVEVNTRKAEEYFLMATSSTGQFQAHLRYAIALVSGRFGRFDFKKARIEFSMAATSSALARVFVNSLSEELCLHGAESVSESASFFGFFVDDFQNAPLIRLMNPELTECAFSESEVVNTWVYCCRSAVHSLLDLSQHESDTLASLATDLASCGPMSEMIPIVLRLYSKESSLYKNVNCFLRSFPVDLIGKLLKELHGVISYIYLLQSSIEQWSHLHPLKESCVVYRGFRSDGDKHALLYQSMIGDVVVLDGFVSASQDKDLVISSFVESDSGLLFEISLPAGAVAVSIVPFSDYPGESEILIAASSGFLVDSVDEISVVNRETGLEFNIPCVKLTYFLSWYDFEVNLRPPRRLL
jgi:hypothetical protein